jgi:predicted nuclease with TOPRIM domain
MKHQLEQRLNELRSEFESGQKALADLEHRQANLRDSLLRISGAIQVLEEELEKHGGDLPEQPDLNELSEPVEMETQSDTGQ